MKNTICWKARYVAPAILATLAFGIGCGPMNVRPAPEVASAASAQTDTAAKPSSRGTFLVAHAALPSEIDDTDLFPEFEIEDLEADDENSPPAIVAPAQQKITLQKGENKIPLYIYHADSNNPMSEAATVSVEYVRVKSKLRRVHHAVVQKDPADLEGRMIATLHIQKEGAWKIRVTISDGDKHDTYVMHADAKF